MVLIFVGFLAAAQSTGKSGHSVSLGSSVGLLGGEAKEIVYYDKGSKDMLSQLLWEMKPLWYAGLDLKYSWMNKTGKFGFFADASYKYGFPCGTGVMEDRDWASENLIYGRLPNWLTQYSVHSNRTNSATLIDSRLGMAFTIFNQFLLKPYISYSYMCFSWKASGGSMLYPYDYGDNFPLPSQVGVIKYKQTWNIPSLGLSFYGEFNRYFDIELYTNASPLVWCSSKDYHLLRSLVITDTLFGGWSIEPGLLFSLRQNGFLTWSLFFSYRHISGARGNGVYKYYNGLVKFGAPDQKGAGYSVFNAGLAIKFNLF